MRVLDALPRMNIPDAGTIRDAMNDQPPHQSNPLDRAGPRKRPVTAPSQWDHNRGDIGTVRARRRGLSASAE